MTVEALVQETERLGIRLVVIRDQFKVIGPATLLKEQAEPLLERLRQHRLEVLAILRRRLPTCSPSCCEIEPCRCPPGHREGSGVGAVMNAIDSTRQPRRLIDPVPSQPCFACGSRLFWRSIYGRVICWHCHPAANDKLVADILWDGEVKWRQ